MRISEVLDFDKYYRDRRFARKKARDGSWKDQSGDNIYYRDNAGRWAQALAFAHTTRSAIKQDTRYPRVFISDYFFYLGENARVIPKGFRSLARMGRGCEYHEGDTVLAFVKWLKRTYRPGLRGQPRDREDDTGAECRGTRGGNGKEKATCPS